MIAQCQGVRHIDPIGERVVMRVSANLNLLFHEPSTPYLVQGSWYEVDDPRNDGRYQFRILDGNPEPALCTPVRFDRPKLRSTRAMNGRW